MYAANVEPLECEIDCEINILRIYQLFYSIDKFEKTINYCILCTKFP